MIACIVPNPALDRTLTVASLLPGETHRARPIAEVAGGKGLNVARVGRALGASPLVCAPIGGSTGNTFVELASDLSGTEWIHVLAETRQCTVLVEDDARVTVLNEPGPSLTDAEWRRFLDAAASIAGRCSTVVVSGSMPGGSDHRLVDVLDAVCGSGTDVWVDTSGPALEAAVRRGGVFLKVNTTEAAQIIPGDDPLTQAVELRRAADAPAAIITAGADGAAYADREQQFLVAAPTVRVVNPVGCGDAFLAGLVVARERGSSAADAVQHAVAVAAAAAAELLVTVDPDFVSTLHTQMSSKSSN